MCVSPFQLAAQTSIGCSWWPKDVVRMSMRWLLGLLSSAFDVHLNGLPLNSRNGYNPIILCDDIKEATLTPLRGRMKELPDSNFTIYARGMGGGSEITHGTRAVVMCTPSSIHPSISLITLSRERISWNGNPS